MTGTITETHLPSRVHSQPGGLIRPDWEDAEDARISFHASELHELPLSDALGKQVAFNTVRRNGEMIAVHVRLNGRLTTGGTDQRGARQ